MKTVIVSGKCSDLCYFAVTDATEDIIYEQQDGYVPNGCGVGGGDNVELRIDIETGQVIGWNAERVKAGIRQYIARNRKASSARCA